MSICIKGLDLPHKGQEPHHLSIDDEGLVTIGGRYAIYRDVEVPPHGRLGDLDAMMAKDTADFAEAMNAAASVSTRSLMRRVHDAIQKAIGGTETIIPADPAEEEDAGC